MRIKANTTDGFYEMVAGGVLDISFTSSKTRRGRVQDGGLVCPTIDTTPKQLAVIDEIKEAGKMPKYRIRKLTQLECLRLMGVSDEDAYKMMAVNSKTQLYKQAGNSIVVDVMVDIFKNLFSDEEIAGQMTIYDYL